MSSNVCVSMIPCCLCVLNKKTQSLGLVFVRLTNDDEQVKNCPRKRIFNPIGPSHEIPTTLLKF